MIKFYCEICDYHRPVEIEPLQTDDLNKGKPPWGDIVCQECHFVIATISASESGVYQFAKVIEVPSLTKCFYPKMVIGFGLLLVSIVTAIGTRVHHAIINPSLTEAQSLVFYLPLWLCAIGLAAAGYAVLKTY